MADKVAQQWLGTMMEGGLEQQPAGPAPPAQTPPPPPPPPTTGTDAAVMPLQGVPMLYGRWHIEDSSGGSMLVDLYPNGMFSGTGRVPQLQQGDLLLQGTWFYDMMLNVLTLQGVVNGMLPLLSSVSFQGQTPDGYVAAEPGGERWTFRRA
jgi:hypothetical protein